MAILEEHLGGHQGTTNIDAGALDWIINELNPKSFLDIGCGPGGMVEHAERCGLDSFGIDGDYTLKRYNPDKFLIHDYTVGPAPLDKRFEFGWSVEFLEHVYEKYIPNYMQSFQQCDCILITYAPPGWGGHHHVNENTQEYWIDTFKNYGFTFNQSLTDGLRNSSTMNVPKKVKPNTPENKLRKAFVRTRGLVFTHG